jgi:hypothetical protein
MLFSYRAAYKITTRYTPYQIVYGLHPLVPTKYIMPIVSGNERDYIPVIINRGFQRVNKSHLGKFTKKWSGSYRI